MRLPGFLHRKGDPFRTRIVRINEAPACKLADLFPEGIPTEEKNDTADNYFADYSDSLKSEYQKLNDMALAKLELWVPKLFPQAQKSSKGWRVSSVALERDLEEDLSFTPEGIKDIGVHDLDDPREGNRTPIDVVLEWRFDVPIEDIIQRKRSEALDWAVDWLRDALGLVKQGIADPQLHLCAIR
jgi:hypothetical protein